MKTIKSLVPALAVGSVLLLAACGGGGSSSSSGAAPAATSTAAPSDSSASSTDQGQGGGGSNLQDPAVQQCLAEKGVTLLSSRPVGDGDGVRPDPPDPGTPRRRRATGRTAAPVGSSGRWTTRPARPCRTADLGAVAARAAEVAASAVPSTIPPCSSAWPARGSRSRSRAPSSRSSPRPSFDDATRQAIQDCRARPVPARRPPAERAGPAPAPAPMSISLRGTRTAGGRR